jgi:peptidyl-prolyl isomerase E (cyclophilin E)
MNKADKRALYVGGLDRQVTEQGLYTAFVPFGPIKSVQIPMDFHSRTSVALILHVKDAADWCVCVAERGKGFGFVEFEEGADARTAMDKYGRCVVAAVGLAGGWQCS